MRLTRIAILAAPVLLLTACDEEPVVPQGDDGRAASGEVLPASISDDMIAVDRLRSQPPLVIDVLEAESRPGDDGGDAPAAEEGEDETSAEVQAVPEPEAPAPVLDLPPPVLDLPPD